MDANSSGAQLQFLYTCQLNMDIWDSIFGWVPFLMEKFSLTLSFLPVFLYIEGERKGGDYNGTSTISKYKASLDF